MLKKLFEKYSDPFELFPWCIGLAYLFAAICGVAMYFDLPETGFVFAALMGVMMLVAAVTGGHLFIHSLNSVPEAEDDVGSVT